MGELSTLPVLFLVVSVLLCACRRCAERLGRLTSCRQQCQRQQPRAVRAGVKHLGCEVVRERLKRVLAQVAFGH